MGAWGTGIFDDDITCDVRDEFFEYLDEGLTVKEATKEILENYDPDEDLEVISLVFIGLAAAQLEKNVLQEEVKKKAIELIDRGADLELWEDADPSDYEERKKVLNEFKQKLLNA
jgi:hypothetical protein